MARGYFQDGSETMVTLRHVIEKNRELERENAALLYRIAQLEGRDVSPILIDADERSGSGSVSKLTHYQRSIGQAANPQHAETSVQHETLKRTE